ncbi:ATP-binding protein [Pseudonocardia lutea]|jgi:anti-sigma regulatory factor (Ser/Thr protein kinase)|uniref:ATP-binding protein n=1 Tax=Pseudonocardia lutea TaxID=2172015 RepID=A0ABW1I8B1_9PSEU
MVAVPVRSGTQPVGDPPDAQAWSREPAPDGPLLEHRFPGEAVRLAAVRRELGTWAAATGLDEETVEDLLLAVYEAMVNAAEHAYSDGERPVDLGAVCTADGCVLVVVRDVGRWRPIPEDPGHRGRGLAMITNLSDHAEIDRGPGGTTVSLWWRLVR